MRKLINIIIIGFIVVSTLINLYFIYNLDRLVNERIEVLDIEPELIIVDSLIYDTVYTEKKEIVKLPIVDTLILTDTVVAVTVDSVLVEVPIHTYHYDTTLSETHISLICEGFDVRLNSLLIERINVAQKQEKAVKTNRFGLGLQLGIGFNEKGFTPYIGVGLNYRLL